LGQYPLEDFVMGGILVGFLQALLYCVIVIIVACAFVWGMRVIGIGIDAAVYKWGKIAIGLICLIIMLTWLLGALGLLGGAAGPHFLWGR
jgi:hypothetical protein